MLRPGSRNVHRDLSTGKTELKFDWHPSRTLIVPTNTEIGEENITTYSITEGDPLSATVACEVCVSLSRPGWTTRVRATSAMSCDAEQFTVTTMLEAFEDGVRVHARTHTHRFPRDGA